MGLTKLSMYDTPRRKRYVETRASDEEDSDTELETYEEERKQASMERMAKNSDAEEKRNRARMERIATMEKMICCIICGESENEKFSNTQLSKCDDRENAKCIQCMQQQQELRKRNSKKQKNI